MTEITSPLIPRTKTPIESHRQHQPSSHRQKEQEDVITKLTQDTTRDYMRTHGATMLELSEPLFASGLSTPFIGGPSLSLEFTPPGDSPSTVYAFSASLSFALESCLSLEVDPTMLPAKTVS